MATKTLNENINQAISDFNGIKQAIIDKGVQVPNGTPTSQYGTKIGEIQSGGSTPNTGFVPTAWGNDGYIVEGDYYGMAVPEYYFQYDKIQNIFFKDALTKIDQYAFYYCSNLALTSLPDSITEIGNSAFRQCTNLALTSLPAELVNVGEYAFQYCKNLSLTSLSNGLSSIGQYAFYHCVNLQLTSLPEEITSLESGAFANCTNLKLTSLPDGDRNRSVL